jgi:hypothetical protein
MHLKLTIYTDDTLTEVKRIAEADGLKIPYRVSIYIAQTLDKIDLKNQDDIFNFVIGSLDKLDKIIKATFGVSETELECIDTAELGQVGVEIYKWGVEKFNSLKANGGNSKNSEMTALT